MAKWDNWPKALVISVLLHCLLLTGVGWLGGNLLKAARVDDLIEVELTNEPSKSEQQETMPVAPPVAAADATGITERPADIAVSSAVTSEIAAPAESSSASLAVNTGGGRTGGAAEVASLSSGIGAATPKKIAAPQLLARVEPLYPEEARQAGAEGRVAVRIEINESGQPGDIVVTHSSGLASFDAAAIEAIKFWKFIPAQDLESGRAVRCYITISLVFKLKT